MSTDEILELELSLLFVKYGERKVLRSLAKVNGLGDTELKTKLKRTRQLERKPSTKKRKQLSSKIVDETIDEIISEAPQKSHLLKLLYSRFQNKSFLPELRDIKRLFNRHSLESKHLKSRNASVPRIFRLLATLDEKELEELSQEQDKRTYSSLGIISAEIMRRD
ncbi:MAG: hypothetical protein QOF62_3118 [Pyrinomonadaceae bacterium]|jgi:hypothetical protein|nr:hypothetical protein [Pyrinomonadaceae bacterium]